MTRRSNHALLTDTVPYSKPIGDTQEKEKWHDAMKTKFNSLIQHNTGHLVPYPTDGSKVIGGTWCLSKKRNKFGKVYRYKARHDNSKPALEGWADSDYANCSVNRKLISGNIVTVFRNPISWMSKRQTVISQSTTEAEFVSMNICSKQLRWVSMLMVMDMNIGMKKLVIYNNNSGSITISKQATLNQQTKHIEVRYQYLRQLITGNVLEVCQVSTNNMLADVLTKPMTIAKLSELLPRMHLTNQEGVLKSGKVK
ncbi:hypothetical protein O181_060524 [Austropuccinia psidii MF-1]|uniref:Reverse transcriptase Ty1/copia-type domain-containing protein n=1 Tax=Austropuccinia psidii MF-1 TaxID=1389203 RepID=A0A9Q3HZQ3_9BASI|nr:hypothetical protein [Austropuccinia psidii MF-1]